jgi:preprotein translocase subunit SecD
LAVRLADEDNTERFDKLLDEEFRDLRIADRTVNNGVTEIVLDIPDTESDHIRKLAVDQALETIRNRIDQFGVSEPDIRIQGERRILIQLPGIKDTQRAKELIGKTALLEFKLLDEEHDVDAALAATFPPAAKSFMNPKKTRPPAASRKYLFWSKSGRP